MKFIKFAVFVLMTGCMAEVDPDSDSNSLNDDYTYQDSDWKEDNTKVPMCRPIVKVFHFNGEIITIIEPAECPLGPELGTIYLPPWNEQVNQDESVPPYDSNPIFDRSNLDRSEMIKKPNVMYK